MHPLGHFGQTTDLARVPLSTPSHATDKVAKIDPKLTRRRAVYYSEADVIAAFPTAETTMGPASTIIGA